MARHPNPTMSNLISLDLISRRVRRNASLAPVVLVCLACASGDDLDPARNDQRISTDAPLLADIDSMREFVDLQMARYWTAEPKTVVADSQIAGERTAFALYREAAELAAGATTRADSASTDGAIDWGELRDSKILDREDVQRVIAGTEARAALALMNEACTSDRGVSLEKLENELIVQLVTLIYVARGSIAVAWQAGTSKER